MKNIIHIYGASGSGTTTLGRKICDELGYTFMDTDDYFWMPTNPMYTTKRDREERIALMRNEIEKANNVVISGSLVDWGDVLIPLFTLVIRLETDTDVRIERLGIREKQMFGKRIEVGGDMYENHKEFIEWAKAYDTGNVDMRSKANHDEWQKLLQCKHIILNGADDLDSNFRKVQDELDNVIGKKLCNELDVPEEIKTLLGSESFSIDDVGMSEGVVLLFSDKVVKIQAVCEESENEHRVMEWLQDRLPVPRVLGFERQNEKNYLVMSKLPGKMSCADEYMRYPERLTAILAEGLQMLWKVDISNCPFGCNLEKKLQMAK
ncbi:MAG TPA: hypothetical protein VHQ24_01900, partial [Lachnospiraceae bacterium]|nr:hypothetical protein [Lachnospiraceae bacterium]